MIKIVYIINLFLLITSFFIIWKLYEKWIFIHTYSYIESVENNNKRYSLYYDYWRDWYSWYIFEHDTNYKKYKEVEMSNVWLKVYNWNPNDKFIYYKFSDNFSKSNPKIEILEDRFLVFSVDWIYHYLYDLDEKFEYYDRGLLYTYKIENWIPLNHWVEVNEFKKYEDEQYNKYLELEIHEWHRYTYLRWKKEKIHKKILDYIEKHNKDTLRELN